VGFSGMPSASIVAKFFCVGADARPNDVSGAGSPDFLSLFYLRRINSLKIIRVNLRAKAFSECLAINEVNDFNQTLGGW